MSQVLDRVREQYPAYRDVPDEQLAKAIGDKYPVYLEQDGELKEIYTRTTTSPAPDLSNIEAGVRAGVEATETVAKTLTSPAVGMASEMGREQAETSRAERRTSGFGAMPGTMGLVKMDVGIPGKPESDLVPPPGLSVEEQDIWKQFEILRQQQVSEDKSPPRTVGEWLNSGPKFEKFPTQKDDPVFVAAAKEVRDQLAGLVEFPATPVGVATFGMGPLVGKIGQGAIRWWFALKTVNDMARTWPDILKQWNTFTPAEKTTHIVDALAGGGLAWMLTKPEFQAKISEPFRTTATGERLAPTKPSVVETAPPMSRIAPAPMRREAPMPPIPVMPPAPSAATMAPPVQRQPIEGTGEELLAQRLGAEPGRIPSRAVRPVPEAEVVVEPNLLQSVEVKREQVIGEALAPLTAAEMAKTEKEPAPIPEPKPVIETARDWGRFNEDLIDDLASYADARGTGRVDYELNDVADRFTAFAKEQAGNRTLLDLFKDFSKQDPASKGQLKKLKTSLANLEAGTEPIPTPEPTSAIAAEEVKPSSEFAPGTRTVVHGGTGEFKKGKPVWFTAQAEDAKWFAGERGGESPKLVEADVTINKPAKADDVMAAAKAVGATPKDVKKHSGYHGENPLDYVYVPKVVAELKRLGFDGVIDSDVLENTSIMAYIPFDKAQVKVKRTLVGQRDWTQGGEFVYKEPKPPPIAKPAEAKAAGVETGTKKIEAEIKSVAKTEGQRPAQEVKDELISSLEEAVSKADSEPANVKALRLDMEKANASGNDKRAASIAKDIATVLEKAGVGKTTIDIPGDGKFTIWNTKEALSATLARAKRVSTKPGAPTKIKYTGTSEEDRAWIQAQVAAQQPTSPPTPPKPMPQGPGAMTRPQLKPDIKVKVLEAEEKSANALARANELKEKGQTDKAEEQFEKSAQWLMRANELRENRTNYESEPLIPQGPGAMTPSELEQRQRTPPPSPPFVTVDAGQTPSPEIVRKAKDVGPTSFFHSPQYLAMFGKLGEKFGAAWRALALGEHEMRTETARDIAVNVKAVMKSLPRPMRQSGGKAFFQLLDGRRLEDIESEWQGKPGGEEVIAAARKIKTRLEEIRTTIRDQKRDDYNRYLMGLQKENLRQLFKDNINADIDTGKMTKQQFSDALSLDEFPDDWGIADGSYLPHLFFGRWRLTARVPGEESPRFVTRTETPAQAKAMIAEAVRTDPNLAKASFTIEPDMVIPADLVRLGSGRFWRLIGEMADKMGTSPQEIQQATRGFIGRKASKTKWWGNLQKRYGAGNYSKDFERVMGAYFSGFNRWKVLTRVNREVAPLIESMRKGDVDAEGKPIPGTQQPEASEYTQALLDYVWGRPTKATRLVDAGLQSFNDFLAKHAPVLADRIKPMALDRWMRQVRSGAALAHLMTVRFGGLVNRLQPLQTLLPLTGEMTLARAKAMQHTPTGRALLDKYGVTFDVGQYGEPGGRGNLAYWRQRLSGERSNQELAFLAGYLHYTDLGMAPDMAAKNAFLNFQLRTQFTPLMSDVPPVLRGPIVSTIFQYKRFSIKTIELMGGLLRDKSYGGIGRMLGTYLTLGGLSYFLRTFMVGGDKKKKLRDALEESYGKSNADILMYGLPGLAGIDISGSLILGDQPLPGQTAYEYVGRELTGPAVSTGLQIVKTITEAERQPLSATKRIENTLRKVPALRPLAELIALESGDTDILSPSGEILYRRKISDVLFNMGSFRTADQSNKQLALDAIVELKKQQSAILNRYYVNKERGITDRSEIDTFNQAWPDAKITSDHIDRYRQSRESGSKKTKPEKISGKQFKKILKEE